MTSRTQTLRLGQTHSDPSELLQGVPHGSVLGPVLYTLTRDSLGGIACDSQLYVSFKIKDTNDETAALARIQACVRKG